MVGGSAKSDVISEATLTKHLMRGKGWEKGGKNHLTSCIDGPLPHLNNLIYSEYPSFFKPIILYRQKIILYRQIILRGFTSPHPLFCQLCKSFLKRGCLIFYLSFQKCFRNNQGRWSLYTCLNKLFLKKISFTIFRDWHMYENPFGWILSYHLICNFVLSLYQNFCNIRVH